MTSKTSQKATVMLEALAAAIGPTTRCVVTQAYKGASDWLILYGVGAPDRDLARDQHVASKRHVLMWDLGYWGRDEYMRCSIDHDHPQAYLDKTEPEYDRWWDFRINLREDADPEGHIILVGLGRKSRAYLHEEEWEQKRLKKLRARFPGREIIYRPKPKSPILKLDCRIDSVSPIEALLVGAAMVSCRHSNVAVDAAIAGVPFECDDGAAMWLQARAYTVGNRLDFLRRLAWWQWRPDEAANAWAFIQKVAA